MNDHRCAVVDHVVQLGDLARGHVDAAMASGCDPDVAAEAGTPAGVMHPVGSAQEGHPVADKAGIFAAIRIPALQIDVPGLVQDGVESGRGSRSGVAAAGHDIAGELFLAVSEVDQLLLADIDIDIGVADVQRIVSVAGRSPDGLS